jgi:hypothetical protein
MVHIHLKAIVPITLNANVRLVEGSTYGRCGQRGKRCVEEEGGQGDAMSAFRTAAFSNIGGSDVNL